MWFSEITRYASENVNRILLGNKCDTENRQVTYEEGNETADSIGVKFMETSAKLANNVEASFMAMAKDIKDRVSVAPKADNPMGQKITPTRSLTKKEAKGSCC
jgi:Ras-related protein Rab-1A